MSVFSPVREGEPLGSCTAFRMSLLKPSNYFRLYKNTRQLEARQKYEESRRNFKRLVWSSKCEVENRLAKNIDKDPKCFFRYVNCKRANKPPVGPLKNGTGNIIDDNSGMAEELNIFFSSVFLSTGRLSELFYLNSDGILNTVDFSRDKVLKAICSLKPTKAPGPDSVYPRFLIEGAEELAEALSSIFDSSMRTGVVPRDWRHANVVPIFKKGDRGEPGNYRPVSLTSIVGKLMETIIKERLSEYLEENEILVNYQHGFRKNQSTLTNLIDFYEEVTKELDIGNVVDVVYLDFQKAFDKVSHFKLITKLSNIGIGGDLLKWISSWLTNRKQRVMINGSYSQWRDVGSGVPQGSVLGPLLFLIFINDMGRNVGGKFSFFADDCKIMRVVNENGDIQNLQDDLDKLYNWANEWDMSFNVGKCHVVHFGYRNICAEYNIGGESLGMGDGVNDLGITICNDFKFSSHCSAMVKKANRMLGFIKSSISSRNKNVILPLYKSLVRPHLEYAVQFWSPHYRNDINCIEKVQRRATKMIESMKDKTYGERLSCLNMYSLEKRRRRGDLIETFKIIRGFDKVRKLWDFNLNDRTRGHGLKLLKVRSRLLLRQSFFTQRVVNDWNSLNGKVSTIETIGGFKRFIDETGPLVNMA